MPVDAVHAAFRNWSTGESAESLFCNASGSTRRHQHGIDAQPRVSASKLRDQIQSDSECSEDPCQPIRSMTALASYLNRSERY